MPEETLYWRELKYDNTEKRYSWVFHNYSIIINSEVLIHIAKADGGEPSSDSPYFTIPYSSYRADIRTEPGDKIYYATRNGGEFSYYFSEINQTHNYEIESKHQELIISGERTITVPEGSMVSLQANPERNGKDSFIKYRIGNRGEDGEFRLYGAQQVAYTFTKETEITFFSSEDFVLSVLITASQNVSQLSKEVQDMLDKLVADLKGAIGNMATKDMLERVHMKTKRDDFIILPSKPIGDGVISTNYFYNKFSDTETEIVDNDIITAEIYTNIVSLDQSKLRDVTGVIMMQILYTSKGCKVLSFTSTNPELTKLTDKGTISINSTTPTKDIDSKNQRLEIKLNIKDELVPVVTGSTTTFIKSNMVPLRSVLDGIVFDEKVTVIHNLDYVHLYQNLVFMKTEDVEKIIHKLALSKRAIDKEYNISSVSKDMNEHSLDEYIIKGSNDVMFKFSRNNDGNMHFVYETKIGEYPVLSGEKLLPMILEVYEDTITGETFSVNLALISVDPHVEELESRTRCSSIFRPIVKRDFEYIEKMLEHLHSVKDQPNLRDYIIRVVTHE